MIHSVLEKITEFGLLIIESIGYIGIFIVSFLENVFTPVPSEAIIPFAGILVSQGKLEVFWVILAATAGSVAGAYVFYGLGYWMGSTRFRNFIIKWGKYIFVSEKDIDRAEKWFSKYGYWAVLLCRVIPIVRSVISIPAGYVKLPIIKFTILTAIGTSIWSTFLVFLGVIFGEAYDTILPVIDKLDYVVYAVLGVAVLFFLYKKWTKRKQIAGR
jgi:membrane protein DedA with SNARE-associated domain